MPRSDFSTAEVGPNYGTRKEYFESKTDPDFFEKYGSVSAFMSVPKNAWQNEETSSAEDMQLQKQRIDAANTIQSAIRRRRASGQTRTKPAPAISSQSRRASLKARLGAYYQQVAPHDMENIDSILELVGDSPVRPYNLIVLFVCILLLLKS